jgi:hypothetical protein
MPLKAADRNIEVMRPYLEAAVASGRSQVAAIGVAQEVQRVYPALLQRICDALQPGTIEVFFQRWLHRLPLPLGPQDSKAGYWWECSMAQVEVSRTLVFRLLKPLFAVSQPQAPPPLRAALRTIEQVIDDRLADVRLPAAA